MVTKDVIWYGGDEMEVNIRVNLFTAEDLGEGGEECPILMQDLKEASVSDLPEGCRYEMQGKAYVAVELPCCKKKFNVLALAMHWMIHNMRCPMCRSGSDERLSCYCLPLSCRSALVEHVKRIRDDISEEMEQFDLEFIESDLLPESLISSLLMVRRWELVADNLQLQVIMHVPPTDATSALERLNQGTVARWNQCSNGVCTFVDLQNCGEDDGTNGFNVQRSHCRRLSKAIRDVGVTRLSFGVCYANGNSIFHVAHTSTMYVKVGGGVSHGSSIYYVNDNLQVELGELYFNWIDDQQKSVQSIRFNLLTDLVMQRLVYGMICVHHLMDEDNVISAQNVMSVFYM